MAQCPEVVIARKSGSNICKSTNIGHKNIPQNSLQLLTHLGVPKHRAEKALAATGDHGPQLACEWLINHANDPELDLTNSREYILYLCPTSGTLLEQLDKFYSSSLGIAFNSAHNYLPHVTLCSFFNAPDEAVTLLTSGLEHCVNKMKSDLPSTLNLEHFTSSSFVGLFLDQDQNDILKRLANMFMRESSEFISGGELGPMHVISTCFPWCSSYPLLNPKRIEVEPYLKSLHLTLAYQFEEEHFDQLKKLAIDLIDPRSSAFWELRLYSRELRTKSNEVHRVIMPHEPETIEELRLVLGDYVYINAESIKSCNDGWVMATSWLSGVTGSIPISNIERTAESAVWTLHKSIALSGNSNGRSCPANQNQVLPQILIPNLPAGVNLGAGGAENPLSSNSKTTCTLTGVSKIDLEISGDNNQSDNNQRKVIIVRHGERVDFTFGKGWINVLFDQEGHYTPLDLNQPPILPPKLNPSHWLNDSPLTLIGSFQANITGVAIRESGIKIDHIFVSPSFRCIQTAANLLSGAQINTTPNLISPNLTLNIEPGLFEWMHWYQDPNGPHFLSPSDLLSAGYPVNVAYVPFMSTKEVLSRQSESLSDHYKRSAGIMKSILNLTLSGHVLIIAHAGSLDTLTYELTGKGLSRTNDDFLKMLRAIPYCGVSMMQEIANQDQDRNLDPSKPNWILVKPPIRTLQHTANQRYDWRVLTV